MSNSVLLFLFAARETSQLWMLTVQQSTIYLIDRLKKSENFSFDGIFKLAALNFIISKKKKSLKNIYI